MNPADDLRKRRNEILIGGGHAEIEKQHAKGKLTARERVELLFDKGSFCEIDGYVKHRCTYFEMQKKTYMGDGVVGGFGTVNGRTIFAYFQDFTVLGGSMGEEQANKICKLIDMAMTAKAPIVAVNDSGGARIQEGINSLAGYAKIFSYITKASGVVPQIAAILGPCAGGAAYAPALMDFVFVIEKTSNMFITGPEVIRAVTGEQISAEDLGGAQVHSKKSGSAHFICPDEKTCMVKIKELLTYMPAHYTLAPPKLGLTGSLSAQTDILEGIVPENPRKTYDMFSIIRYLTDLGDTLEYMRDFAPNIITMFARINGMPMGIIANQPNIQAGCLDIDASDKAARFVRTCDAFGLPLLTLVDTPGFLPGVSQEHAGIIRHGAKLLYAYSEATTPKVTVIIRKAFGGAYIAMCSKNIGCDMVFAWPTAQIAVMGEESAANILLKTETDHDARQKWLNMYRNNFMNPYQAAQRGQVNDVILPLETRLKVSRAFDILMHKTREKQGKMHGNIPL